MSTVTGKITNGITLGQAGYTSPLTIASKGAVSSASGPAIYASSSYANPVVVNRGTIIDTGPFAGIELNNGGCVGNLASGALIQGYTGVDISGGVGTVTNSGTIVGTKGSGIILAAGGTVVDSGLIIGGISFGGTGGNLLALENGYRLTGGVAAAGTGNTLELLGAAGAVTVDFNRGFTGFGTVAFGPTSGRNERLGITDTASLPGMISGFTDFHDSLILTQINPKGATATLNAQDQLVVSNGSQSVSLQLDPSENYNGVVWVTTPDGSFGTDVSPQNGHTNALTSFSFADISGAPSAGGTASPSASAAPVPQGNGDVALLLAAGDSVPAWYPAGHGPPFG